ncbi:hypothetical protein GUITHDRAFT_99599 [Guillardia theta CCMP2712]|uniref:Peptidase M13 C-terminal domain-containing protein n=1 Tax=Guillardia theta (strain CCMP2712) TaxID=905079 RepID=L1K3A9_GUITC|nr:hypothetical protein GUITHDRAFT_99599 [Guillardia theta CCMP2712]EKX54950.1 hypothetical protein GUITHDRAFT_99599 [Guillardia theta CCMP2712]|eukprot:XP_005841930.1 hypothetical protein GUITHDRAFT_99599 [Guillardia theta CCMP2712]
MEALTKWAKTSIVGDANMLATWRKSRSSFLMQLPEEYPESVKKAMNFSQDPCDNFFEFSCGSWVAQAQIPPSQGGIAMAWDEAEDKSYETLHSLMLKDYPQDSKFRKVQDWFHSCMDTERVESLHAQPLRPWLAVVDGIKNHEQLWDAMVKLQLWSIPTPISLQVTTDEKDPSVNDLFLDAGGLILPDATYYDDEDADSVAAMQSLKEYVHRIVKLSGYSDVEAEEAANRTLEIEMAFSEAQFEEPAKDLDDGFDHYNLTQLEQNSPHIPWAKYFAGLKAGCERAGVTCLSDLNEGRKKIVLDSPVFYSTLSEMFANNSAEYWVPYLRTHVIYNLSPLLSSNFLNATFKLDAELEGTETLPPRWKKCVAAVKHALPGLTDQLYIQSTKTAALEKAKNIEFNIGSPSSWSKILQDYPVSAQSYFNNSMQAYHRQQIHMLSKVDKKVDRKEWSMRASTVNAYYDNGVTSLFVPAAVLQPPFFSDTYKAVRNFGGIGCVMGHEFTHGFDNTGRKFDAHSRMREWWQKPVVSRFREHSHCIEKLYDNFEIAGENVDGNGTLGENIADMGGLKISLRAWEHLHTQTHGAPPSLQEQRLFFVSFAQNWCDKNRQKAEEQTVLTDEHSPNIFRVNGPVSQNPDFAQAFGCPVGSPMNPNHRCVLWKDVAPSEELLFRKLEKDRKLRALRSDR